MKRTLLTDLQKFRKFKKSSTFYRKIEHRIKKADIMKSNFERATTLDEKYITSTSNLPRNIEKSTGALESILFKDLSKYENVNFDCWSNCDAESSDNDDVSEDLKTECINIREALKEWAVTFHICHNAIKALLDILILSKIPNMPRDPRTLLETPRTVVTIKMGSGQYWHNGLKTCLEKCLSHVENPIDIALNFNIDGLPIHNSSKMQFWPILFSIHDSNIEPMIIGIYCGENKPPTPDEFLTPFVDELLTILNNGIIVNGYKINIHIRCFICDTPARSFIKGNKVHRK